MIELAFVACLASAPSACEDKALQFADVSLLTCIMGAQPQLARWQRDNPGWKIRGWTCRHPQPGRSI